MNTPYIQDPPGGDGQGAARSTGTGGSEAGATTDSLVQQARDRGHERIDSARKTGADSLERLADDVREAASELENDQSVGNLSQHFVRLADGMARVASGLREKSGDDLVREVGRLARENPTVFVAGAVALGFGLTRFGRASARRDADESGIGIGRGGEDQSLGSGVYGGSGGVASAATRDGSANTDDALGSSSLAGAYGGAGSTGSSVSGTGTDHGVGGSTVSGTGTDYGAGGSTISGTDASFGTATGGSSRGAGSGRSTTGRGGSGSLSGDERGGPSV